MPLAAVESGALAYYLPETRVVNIDGVVNHDAYRAIRRQDLTGYLLARGVTSVACRDEGWILNSSTLGVIPKMQRVATNPGGFSLFRLVT